MENITDYYTGFAKSYNLHPYRAPHQPNTNIVLEKISF